ncbi:hypothetical protein [Arthrobacter sp. ISL-72]|uniref:hypothetical protein n=1 Tax=Arthrobacter sp. ISL-72 TaxID=2819114 RepID=UPI002034E3FE|nr:hypothetical protein [Arthrobacter sp. ISL-72]
MRDHDVHRKAASMEMNLRDNWHRLSAATRQWLSDNPGCLILPRTLVATICEETGLNPDCDRHGETTLSQEDRDFIRAQANPASPTGPEHRFFDSNQP